MSMKTISCVLAAGVIGLMFCPLAYGQARPPAGPPANPGIKPADVTSQQVAQAIEKAKANIKQMRAPAIDLAGSYSTWGTTALMALSLINAGVPADDPAVSKLLEAVQKLPNTYTYSTALKIQALAAADPKKYFEDIRSAAEALFNSQTSVGMWSYGAARGGGGRGDNSNTQFALLGLHEAAKAGVKIPDQVWTHAQNHFVNTQIQDGGWMYVFSGGSQRVIGPPGVKSPSYGSMTAAGVASLYICGQRLQVGGPKVFANGAYPGCGKYMTNLPLAAGLKWLADNFSVTSNPNHGVTHLYYYLYALERVGMLSGVRNIGDHDWYREGAAFLVGAQRADGGWGSQHDTCFCLLFLAKGNRPVLFQKVQWKDAAGKEGRWNRNIHDLENLTAFIGDKLGKVTTWQTTSLDVPIEQLRMSPILLITGHEFPAFNAAQKQKLRQFVDTGGTLLFEACCGSDPFRRGFRALAQEVWPEYTMRRLNLDHPVFNSLFPIKDDTYGLEGMDVGCRTSVFYSPNALSCLWELQTIPQWSDKAFTLGANIAAYATGREQLANKLDRVELSEPGKFSTTQPTEVPRGAVRIARLRHDGDFNADPHALVNLAAALRDKARMDVVAKDRQIDATDDKIYEYPVLFMTGHYTFELSVREVDALRNYLNRGGFLVADACCGQLAFDKSFRELARQLYPDDDLRQLDDDHPIYSGKVGLPLGELKYRQALAQKLGARGTTRPPLEAVTVKGRTVILYSKYDWTCAFEGDNPFSCYGYIDADGQRLGLNMLLYAISY